MLYQWLAGARTKLPLVVQTEGKPPVLRVETWAGSAMLSKEWVRLGFTVKAHECLPDGVYLPDGDLSRPQVQAELHDDITSGRVYHAHVAVTCTTWAIVRALGGRTPVSPNT